MTTTTLDKNRVKTDVDPGEDTAAKTSARRAKKDKADTRPSKRRAVWSRLAPTRSTNGLPIVIWVAILRSIVLIAFYLIAAVTAQAVIPSLGLWLHQESGASQTGLTIDGTIALWVVPLLFSTALLAAGEIAVMRGMWRWSSRMIQKIRDKRVEVSVEPATTAATTTNRRRKKNRRRSK